MSSAKPNLTPHELVAAKSSGMSPEEYASYRDLSAPVAEVEGRDELAVVRTVADFGAADGLSNDEIAAAKASGMTAAEYRAYETNEGGRAWAAAEQAEGDAP